MRSALAYRPQIRPLQLASPAAAVAYLGALVVAAFLFSNPLILIAVTTAGALAGMLAGVGPAVRLGLRLGLLLTVLMILVNGLVTSRGATVIARLGEWPLRGSVEVTAEALAAGAVIGLRAMAVMVVMSVYSAAVDPDRILRALRPIAGRSALTAGLVSRMVPVALADTARLSQAARLRGPAAAPVGRAQLARRLLAGSLDRSVDVAATLELRGYGLRPAPGSAGREMVRSRHNRRFYAVAIGILLLAVGGSLAGVGGFEAFPRVVIATDAPTGVLAGLFALTGLAPLRARRRKVGGHRG